MIDTSPDPALLDGLRSLGAPAPLTLLGAVVAHWVTVDTPIGDISVAFGDAGICFVHPADGFAAAFRSRVARPLSPAARPPAGLVAALRSGRGAGLRYDLRGTTPFQRAVLQTALEIPRGQIRPYAWIAARVGSPAAVRAVGTALGRNPVPILIPCHRVTRSDGVIGDYAFGSPAKDTLLRAERVPLDDVRALARQQIYYVGSATTHIVCFPTCAHARRITDNHRQGFRTMAEAGVAGYRPCLDCRPTAAPPPA